MAAQYKRPCILVVDDSSEIRELIKAFYEGCGFDLIEAVNGKEAVEITRSFLPDLILMDIEMPVMNGCQAATLIKNDNDAKHIPILFITGELLESATERLRGKFAGLLCKPFQQAELLNQDILESGFGSDNFIISQLNCLEHSVIIPRKY